MTINPILFVNCCDLTPQATKLQTTRSDTQTQTTSSLGSMKLPWKRGRRILGVKRINRTGSSLAKDGISAESHALRRMQLLHDFCMAIFNVTPQCKEVTISFSGSTHQGLKSKKSNQAAHRFPFGTVRTNVREIYVNWLVSGNRDGRMLEKLEQFGVNVDEIPHKPTKKEVEEFFDKAYFTDLICVNTREFGVATQGTDDLHYTINQADSHMERFLRRDETKTICKKMMRGKISREEGERLIQAKLIEHFQLADAHLQQLWKSAQVIGAVTKKISIYTPTKPDFPQESPGSIGKHFAIVTSEEGRGMGKIPLSFTGVKKAVREIRELEASGADDDTIRAYVQKNRANLKETAKKFKELSTNKIFKRKQIYNEQLKGASSYKVPEKYSSPVRQKKEKELGALRNSVEKKRSRF